MTSPVPILMYHSIDDFSAPRFVRWSIPPAIFDAQMQWLADNDYRPVTISALVSAFTARENLPPRTVAITFDDGLRDFLTGALPILTKRNFPATLYVATEYVGGTSRWLRKLGEGNRPMLNWEELRSIAAAGIECGAHTATHPELDILAADVAAKEIRQSKRSLEDGIGAEVRSFAYPFGYATGTTRRLVEETGFHSACRVRNALSSCDENRFALSRITMTRDIAPDAMGPLLTGRTGLPVAPSLYRPSAQAWRLVRRLRRSFGMHIQY